MTTNDGDRPRATRSTAKRSGATRTAAPGTVLVAGGLVALEGAIALVVGVVELVRGLTGSAATTTGAYGLAFWMIPMGAAVLAGGVALLRGKRWGRTVGVLTNLLLGFTGISGAFAQSSPLLGYPLLAPAIVVLVLLFSPPTVAWLEGEYRRD
ncbi:hypothetical protein [Tsukamurella pseudospumae]|uniref:Integral membrane protein n=1 Tax=Tsukamurella pseudospumae TaxID=239498 RepID=A0A138ABQ3_9ACTN|nr:hypothetical protein [Tsukamurella pseudospumae]KXP01027.1 hypothetical protein AXK61_13655 [Tsukamurella pseudospumae]KXP07873.1 hypothetical protein AXK60_09660 [Tsukamurella pseudospumae]